MQPVKYFNVQKFRPSPLPIKGLPLGLRAVGHFYSPSGTLPPVRYSTYTVIAWGVRGSLRVTIEDMGVFDLNCEQIMVIMPGLKFVLDVLSDDCEFRYFAIDGPQSHNIVLSAGLWTGIFPSREVPVGWLNVLCELVCSEQKDDQILAASRAHDLVVFQAELAKELTRDNLIYQAQWYIHRNWYDCELNVDSIISHLNVGRATLSTRFKKKTNISILEYITAIRLNSARRLLKTTSMPIAEISSMCGLKDASYFSRLFRKETGYTPLQYRVGADTSQIRKFIIDDAPQTKPHSPKKSRKLKTPQ